MPTRPTAALFRLLGLSGVLIAAAHAAGRWELAFFHDRDDSSLSLRALQAPAPGCAVAAAYLRQGSRVRPVLLRTQDAGKTWHQQQLKENPISLFFLNPERAWMATEKGIWTSTDAGATWRKISSLKGMLAIHFASETNGWAAGLEKRVMVSTDGGVHWTPLPEAAAVQASAARSVFSWIEFAPQPAPSSQPFGLIVGFHQPDRPGDPGLPAWMEPQRSRRRKQLPSLTLLLQTLDGGQTWKGSTSSMFGRITRVRFPPQGPFGLVLVEFFDAFDYPSEVYRMDRRSGGSTRIYREKTRHVTDVGWIGAHQALLAAVELPGTLPDAPLPGKVKILISNDLTDWQEMETDYRAVAGRVTLACRPDGEAWAATDTGMILRLPPAPAAR